MKFAVRSLVRALTLAHRAHVSAFLANIRARDDRVNNRCDGSRVGADGARCIFPVDGRYIGPAGWKTKSLVTPKKRAGFARARHIRFKAAKVQYLVRAVLSRGKFRKFSSRKQLYLGATRPRRTSDHDPLRRRRFIARERRFENAVSRRSRKFVGNRDRGATGSRASRPEGTFERANSGVNKAAPSNYRRPSVKLSGARDRVRT